MAWISFCIAFGGMLVGLLYLDLDVASKGFMAMTYLFSITSCFTLAKVIRDKHEAGQFLNKVEHAKTEKFMTENSSVI